jgi:hypothetical protein
MSERRLHKHIFIWDEKDNRNIIIVQIGYKLNKICILNSKFIHTSNSMSSLIVNRIIIVLTSIKCQHSLVFKNAWKYKYENTSNVQRTEPDCLNNTVQGSLLL